MPKGQYARKPWDEWQPEHDAHLKHLMDNTQMSYAEITRAMNAHFAGGKKHFTRNGVLGRAHRKGWKSQRASGGQVGSMGRKPRTQSKAFGNLGVKGAHAGRPRKAKPTAPLVMLRDDNDPGEKAGPTRKLSANDPRLAERRKGHIAQVVEAAPLTSRPFFETERTECKWPTSLDVQCMEVCGEPATCGAYCDRHGAVAYRVLPTRKRQGSYHKEASEHAVRLEHDLNTADQSVIPMFIGHGGADVFLLEDHSHQDFEDAQP